ncbi:MAG: hypothetical protein IJW18_05700 [Lachnospiraceae bacterium]|nr:hypothetical protein [Lachnospiraceae bacterium]
MNNNIRFIKYIPTICVFSGLLILSGCKKEPATVPHNSQTNGYNGGTTISPEIPTSSNSSVTVTNPTTTLPLPDFELPTLTADNISISVGESIDYISNLTIDSTMVADVTQISVDSSTVRPSVPGVYKATYTVTYRGYPVLKTIVVTVSAPKDSTTPTYSATPAGTSIGNMSITLSSGAICSIPCTTEHFITSSVTDRTYSTLEGNTYLTSVLKVSFSDGEVIELETIYNRAVAE